MTPPIGVRTDNTNSPTDSLMEVRPAAAIADAGFGVIPRSQVADYTYRIAALAAGLALLATVV